MNPIITILANCMSGGRVVTRVEPNDRRNPTGVSIHFHDGSREEHTIDTVSPGEFMKTWKEASAWSHIHWGEIE